MEMIRVASTAIISVGYDPESRKMRIRFKQGRAYSFCNVPQHVFDKFLSASSKGRYYDRYIKDRYRCW